MKLIFKAHFRLLRLFSLVVVLFIFSIQGGKVRAACDPLRCVVPEGAASESTCNSVGGSSCHAVSDGSSLLWCSCSSGGGGSGTPTPPPAGPTSTPPPSACQSFCGTTACAQCPSGSYLCGSTDTSLCYTAPTPTSAPPSPSAYCGDGVCNGSEYCGSCAQDCGSCGAAACGSQSYSACGGGYCCGGEVCGYYSTGEPAGCCPASAPYFDGAGCLSGPPAPTPTPVQVCSPNQWCGSQCLSACHTSDLYCNSTGTACNVVTGDYVGNWCGCAAPTPTPPPTGGTCVNGCVPSSSQTGCNSSGGSWVTQSGTCSAGQVCGYCNAGGGTVTTPPPPSGTTCGAGTFLCGYPGAQTCCTTGFLCYGGPPASCTDPAGLPTGPPPTPTISGTVYNDVNGNGFKDFGESGMGGIMVMANNCTSTCDTQTTTTDAAGNYSMTVTWFTATYTVQPILVFGQNYIVSPTYRAVTPPATNVDFGLWQGNTMNGTVFIDTNSNGIKDAGESAYKASSLSVQLSTGNCADGVDNDGDGQIDKSDSRCHSDRSASNNASYNSTYDETRGTPTSAYGVSTSAGTYLAKNMSNGTYQVYLSTLPSGYEISSINPVFVTLNGGVTRTADFGIKLPIPSCVGGLTASPTTVEPGGQSTLSVINCSNVPTPPPTPFNWNPDTGGNNPPPTIIGQTDSPPGIPTNSTTTWKAPVCPNSQKTYTPQVTVGTAGNTVSYSTAITVPATYTVKALIREVTDSGSCTATSGSPYTKTSTGVNLSGGSLPPSGITQPTSTGTTSFTCVVGGSYQVSLSTPSGYSVIGVMGGTRVGQNGISLSAGPSNPTPQAVFCIAPIDPWFQTDFGDVRFNNLKNPVPTGLNGSTSTTYPGIFYSSNFPANFGDGNASTKDWVVENEYSYNTKTQNRNGSMSYDFYRAKAKQEGVSIIPIDDGIVDINSLVESGVYEVKGVKDGGTGNITINTSANISGKHIVLLAEGNAIINNNITVGGGGLLIIASKGTLTVSPSVTNLDGYYAAQGNIILESTDPLCKANTDTQLVVNGALVSNSLKPFANGTGGKIDIQRTLCINNLTTPALKVNSRPDFLLQLTDFYKTTYTKWSEVNP